MNVGFTGTQKGMTSQQRHRLRQFFKRHQTEISEFHHGDCVGADAEAHIIADVFGFRIVVHPPINPRKRAFMGGGKVHKPLSYLERNKTIVETTDVLIVCPKEENEVVRSGTWSTWRYARKRDSSTFLISPTGRVTAIVWTR